MSTPIFILSALSESKGNQPYFSQMSNISSDTPDLRSPRFLSITLSIKLQITKFRICGKQDIWIYLPLNFHILLYLTFVGEFLTSTNFLVHHDSVMCQFPNYKTSVFNYKTRILLLQDPMIHINKSRSSKSESSPKTQGFLS